MDWWQWLLVSGLSALVAAIVGAGPTMLNLLRGRATSRRADVDQLLKAHERFEAGLQDTIDVLRREVEQLTLRMRHADHARWELTERVAELERTNGGGADDPTGGPHR